MKSANQTEVTFEGVCCATCAAWKQTQGFNGECHLNPPVPLFAGFQQPPQVAGLQLNGKLPPQPIILGAFPAVNAQNVCRQWHQDAPVDIEKAPECPVEGGRYLTPRTVNEFAANQIDREIEGAKHQDE